MLSKTLAEINGSRMGKVSIIAPFNMDKNATAMTIEKHNKLLHNTAVVSIKNIWSITEKNEKMTEEELTKLGLSAYNEEVRR